MRIMVVDDSRLVTQYVCDELNARGYTAEPFANGKKALEAARKDSFDLLICDLMMPGLNGLSTIRAIRDERPHLPVFVLSALSAGEWEEQCREAGAACYLQKPVSIANLVEQIEMVAASRAGLDIGIIDRDPYHCRRLSNELSSLGCRVRAWREFKDLPKAASTLTLLVVDTASDPDFQAFAWAREQRIPAVACGPGVGSEDDRYMRAGASICMEKPIDGRDLVTQVRFLIG